MNIHLKIKECVDKKGAEIIVTNTLISILDDEQVFAEIETLPYKKILRNIIREGYTRKLLDLGGYTPEVSFLASQYAQENLMQEAPIQYVLDCLAYGLGWTSNEPTLQTLVSQAEKAREEAEEKIRKGKEFYKSEEFNKAFSYLKEGLEVIEDAEAQYYLAVMYGNGKGVALDILEWGRWSRKSAEHGNPNGLLNLAVMYELGVGGVTQNYSEAAKWYRKSAEHGILDAQVGLGNIYMKGLGGISQNYTEAIMWFSKAVEQGDARAMCGLGTIYAESENYSEAVKWYRKAAEQGDLNAVASLGYMYFMGYGVSKNYSEAVKWYRKAAEQGDVNAMYNLGIMYSYDGLGISQDWTECVKWVRRAAKQGHDSAEETLKTLAMQGLPAAQACFDSNGNLK